MRLFNAENWLIRRLRWLYRQDQKWVFAPGLETMEEWGTSECSIISVSAPCRRTRFGSRLWHRVFSHATSPYYFLSAACSSPIGLGLGWDPCFWNGTPEGHKLQVSFTRLEIHSKWASFLASIAVQAASEGCGDFPLLLVVFCCCSSANAGGPMPHLFSLGFQSDTR